MLTLDLKIGRLSWIIPGRHSITTRVLKREAGGVSQREM